MTYIDDSGAPWEIIDFRFGPPPRQRKKRLPIGDPSAEGRAFHRPEETRIYWFGLIAYRDTKPKTLETQFAAAKPTTAPAARHHWDK